MTSIFGYPTVNENPGVINTDLEVVGKLTVDGPGETKISGSKTVLDTSDTEIKDNAILIGKGIYGSMNGTKSGLIWENRFGYHSLFSDYGILHNLSTATIPSFNADAYAYKHGDFVCSNNVLYDTTPTLTFVKDDTKKGFEFKLTGTSLDIKDTTDNKSVLTFTGSTKITSNVPFSILNGVENKILKLDGSKNMVSTNIEENQIVTTNTDQAIGGNKTFSNPINPLFSNYCYFRKIVPQSVHIETWTALDFDSDAYGGLSARNIQLIEEGKRIQVNKSGFYMVQARIQFTVGCDKAVIYKINNSSYLSPGIEYMTENYGGSSSISGTEIIFIPAGYKMKVEIKYWNAVPFDNLLLMQHITLVYISETYPLD